MLLNVDKCQVITFHRKHAPHMYDYFINGIEVNRVYQVKDLGVMFNCDLKFNSHYNAVVNKAFRTLGFLYRNSREFQSADTLKSLYFTLVRSSLEYSSVTWSPMYNIHIDAFEKVQRVLLRMLAYKSNELDNNTQTTATS
uniref:Reverse transcriptase n=1 Tax=Cacopsylla melanoneura TaxID=428564 RepID=A0A8D8ZWV8_9HEMI